MRGRGRPRGADPRRRRLPHLRALERAVRRWAFGAASSRRADRWPGGCAGRSAAGGSGAPAGRIRRVGGPMIVLFNPLLDDAGQAAAAAVGAVARRGARGHGAVGAGRRQHHATIRAPIIAARLAAFVAGTTSTLLGVTVMPGPQLSAGGRGVPRRPRAAAARADRLGRLLSRRSTRTPCSRSPFVDFVVRSQGEQPLLRSDR